MKKLIDVLVFLAILEICSTINTTQVRLVNGYSQYSGRVEVYFNGSWGTVCDDSFGLYDVKVICRMLGMEFGDSNSKAYPNAFFGQGSGNIVLDNLGCYGTESDLSQCASGGWLQHNCYHRDDAGVDCNWGSSTNRTQVRLVNGYSQYSGRVEVYYNGSWGTVCSHLFDNNDAYVICKMLGMDFGVSNSTSRNNAFFGAGSGNIVFDYLQCYGNESDLAQCDSKGWLQHYCNHGFDAGVDCQWDSTANRTQVRLVNGYSPYSGRVEVYFNSSWGTVCDNSFGRYDVKVICRKLGMDFGNRSSIPYPSAFFGDGIGNIVLDNLRCGGNELDLSHCGSNGWLQHRCNHSQDAGVDCQWGSANNDTLVRLVNGYSESSGRVEVYYGGSWATVCDDYFDVYDVMVICRMLGMEFGDRYSVPYKSALFGEGNGNIVVDNLFCNGNELDLSQCGSNGWLQHSCNHSQDAGVDCQWGSSTNLTQVRLVDGYSQYSGRVEVYYGGSWGTVCDDAFDLNDVKVICRMLGMEFNDSYSRPYLSAFFGEGSGNIIFDDLGCYGNESDLSQCRSDGWLQNDCHHSEDAGVDCQWGQNNTCPSGWHGNGASCYLVAIASSLTFNEAVEFCHNQSSYLVIIETSEENVFLADLLYHGYVFWIGMTLFEANGTWKWYETNETVSYTDWSVNRPIQSSGYQCCYVYYNADKTSGYWFDNPCYYHYSALCEKAVTNENGLPRGFNLEIYTVSISEGATIGITVLTVNVTDNDDTHFTYTIIGGNVDNVFGLTRTSGTADITIINTTRLDYETTKSYTLVLKAIDSGGLFGTATVSVTVLNYNEYAPVLTTSSSATSIPENSPTGTAVIQISATDADDGKDGELTYTMSSGANDTFTIDPNSGEVTTSGALDRETVSLHTVIIDVVDRGTDPGPLTAQFTLTMTVADINDVAPVCSNSPYSGNISENAIPGTIVAQLDCTDADAETPNNVVNDFAIASGNTNGAFSVSSTGKVTTVSQLDRETTESYYVEIVVTDSGTNPSALSTTVSLSITVADVNDNTPNFRASSYIFSIDEDLSIGTLVGTVTATDADSRLPGEITYSIILGNTNFVMAIDSRLGDITLVGDLDYETTKNYSIAIIAIDNQDPPNTGTVTMTVNVNDVNDVTPMCPSDPVIVTLSENFISLQHIATITCNDTESGVNGLITYVISTVDGDLITFPFLITAETGELRTTFAFDYENDTLKEVVIHAIDGGTPSLTGIAILVVNVTDLNEYMPVFNGEPYFVTVLENTTVGSIVYQVAATDADTDNIITFGLDLDSAVFKIDAITGELSLISALDFENVYAYSIVVVAADDGIPPLSATATVTITVTDVNDVIPVFDSLSYTASVSENAVTGTTVIKVVATDADSPNLEFIIASRSDQGVFGIENSGSLIISSRANLDYDSAVKNYTLIIHAYDGLHTGTTTIDVEVTGYNEHSPVFSPMFSTQMLAEDTPIGTTIITVVATDADHGADGVVTYSITTGNVAGSFAIDSLSGILTLVKEIDIETTDEYVLHIDATDGGILPRSLSTQYVQNLIITDVNDFTPVCKDPEHAISIAEDAPTGLIVAQLSCSDSDKSEPNNVISAYSIKSGNTGGSFLTSSNGEVTIGIGLDRETLEKYTLLIDIKDGGIPSLTATVKLTINVTDVNDNAPAFVNNPYRITTAEDVAAGTILKTVVAIDGDSGQAGTITYGIVSGNGDFIFEIDSLLGELKVISSLDFEKNSTHVLEIIAFDNDVETRLTGTTTLYLNVTDVNDNGPLCTPVRQSIVHPEDTLTNSRISSLTCHDMDSSSSNSDLIYTIVSVNGALSSIPFAINSSGVVTLATSFDYELVQSYKILIVVNDRGTPSLSFQATVNVDIIDVNEHTPIFQNTPYNSRVSETNEVGNIVYAVSATDNDIDDTITYQMYPSNTYFNISVSTGQIYTIASIDYDVLPEPKTIVAYVNAYDDGSPGKTATETVMFTVTDVNDGIPTFNPGAYSVSITENAVIGTTVTTITASDIDNLILTFGFASGNDDNVFTIESTGDIVISNVTNFDYDSAIQNYVLVVQATDSGAHTGTATVFITVTNINDNKPILTESGSSKKVVENSPIGTVIVDIDAIDADYGPDGVLTYTITNVTNSGYGKFTIDPASGELVVSGLLDAEDTNNYTVTIDVTDSANNPRAYSDTYTLIVTITDVNDNHPVCSENLDNAIVKDDSTPGTIVVTLLCTDNDAEPPNNNVSTYIILSGNTGSKFSISNTGVVTTTADIDSDELDNYKLAILVIDSGTPALTATTTLSITVTGKLLFEYGDATGDIPLQTEENGCSSKIVIEYGVPISEELYTGIYVCENGVISFNKPFSNPTPVPSLTIAANRTLIAPYHADITLNKSGQVYYRWFDVHNISVGGNDVDIAKDVMKTFIVDDEFSPTFLLVVTWVKVVPFRNDASLEETATFQLVLLSDGFSTFTSFQYANGQMNWRPRMHEQTGIWIGYTFPGYIYTNLNSFTQAAFKIDKLIKTRGKSGLALFRLTSANLIIRNDAMECINWYYTNVGLNNTILSFMPECPCSLERLGFDPWFSGYIEDMSPFENTSCFIAWPSTRFGSKGKTCCYDSENGLYISAQPRSGGFIHYHPLLDPTKHELFDRRMKEQCCINSVYCHLYYEINPSGECYTNTWFRSGTFWGDPHFETLDGQDFTFNGLGEYVLLQIDTSGINFSIQARTSKANDVDDMDVNATVFSAFAARDNSGASLHVELNDSKTGFIIYGNNKDLTKRMKDDPVYIDKDNQNLFLLRYNDSLGAYFTLTETLMTISVTHKMLDLSLSVADKFRGVTRGLLGNYDGDPTNDLAFRDGSKISTNATGEEIFKFGQSWIITESAFKYEEGKNDSFYVFPEFIPEIHDTFQLDEYIDVNVTCADKRQCVFDQLLTRNSAASQHTATIADFTTQVRTKLNNRIPLVKGCGPMNNVQLGSFATCSITIEDDSDAIKIEIMQNGDNAKVSNISHAEGTTTADVVIFANTTNLQYEISLIAVDKEGERSSPIVIDMLMCNGCHEHGHCDLSKHRNKTGKSQASSRLAVCICEPYWTGKDCEIDLNGCASSPCSLGRECTDQNASAHMTSRKAFTCKPCPSGYTDENEGTACIDINECLANNGSCEQDCINTEGSYVCSCWSGYRTDESLCIDINECDEGLHDCPHMCTNTGGGYNCSCHKGYSYSSDFNHCIQDTDNTECNTTCPEAHGCLPYPEASCFCHTGFNLLDNNTCIDTNECDANVCQQACTNTIGSFTCSCYGGYILEEDNTCTRCDDSHWGLACAEECRCTYEGASVCDPARGCICKAGWEGLVCDIDVNECLKVPNACGLNQRCENLDGTFRCLCMDGFVKDGTGACLDINECEPRRVNNCTRNQSCKNTIGGYVCECLVGYTEGTDGVCADIDECQSSISNCEQLCENVPGQYNCYCIYGYRLNEDRQTCTDDTTVADICETYNMSCKHLCKYEHGHAKCGCRLGYKLALDGVSCIDIDECSNETANLCRDKQSCRNTEGGYKCACAEGYKLGSDGRTCKGCDIYHYGSECVHECRCGPGASHCDPVLGCVCRSGWMGFKCDMDKDECAAASEPCTGDHKTCINTPGAYTCKCTDGYETMPNGVCQDVDECHLQTTIECDQKCVNTEGSFRCDCNKGFARNGSKCRDIDECNGMHDCDHNCTNTIGGYRCSCKQGFILDLQKRQSCSPINRTECKSFTCNNGTCVTLNNGTEECVCNKGNSLQSQECIEINECETKTCPDDCINLVGSYICICPTGKKLDVDRISCIDCEYGHFGSDCDTECPCVMVNTETCNPVNGSCKCLPGWRGLTCAEDIDECKQGPNPCTDNSSCRNTNGSHTCRCYIGYFKTSEGHCQPCDRTHYGQDCASNCRCTAANTVTCDNIHGRCNCMDGWQGDNCDQDVNECETRNDSCVEHQTCANIDGGYICSCDSGYTEVDGICRDIDECLEKDDTRCEYECSNTDGAYECICPRGKEGYWNDCHDCSRQNTYGVNCSNVCPCQHDNAIDTTQSCDPISGQCLCLPTWTGIECTADVNECGRGTHNCSDVPNTGCRNVPGGFVCDCLRGFTGIAGYTGCKKDDSVDVIEDIPANKTRVPMTLTMAINLENGTNLGFMSGYSTVKAELTITLIQAYTRFTVMNMTVQIRDIREGPVVVDFYLFIDDTEAAIGTVLWASSLLATGGVAEFRNQTVDIINLAFVDSSGMSVIFSANTSLCNAFEAIFNCSGGSECIVENNKPQCKAIEENSKLSALVYVWIASGSTVLLFLISVAVARCIRARRLRDTTNTHPRTHRSSEHAFDSTDSWNIRKPLPVHLSHGRMPAELQTTQHLTWKSNVGNELSNQQFHIARPRVDLGYNNV